MLKFSFISLNFNPAVFCLRNQLYHVNIIDFKIFEIKCIFTRFCRCSERHVEYIAVTLDHFAVFREISSREDQLVRILNKVQIFGNLTIAAILQHRTIRSLNISDIAVETICIAFNVNRNCYFCTRFYCVMTNDPLCIHFFLLVFKWRISCIRFCWSIRRSFCRSICCLLFTLDCNETRFQSREQYLLVESSEFGVYNFHFILCARCISNTFFCSEYISNSSAVVCCEAILFIYRILSCTCGFTTCNISCKSTCLWISISTLDSFQFKWEICISRGFAINCNLEEISKCTRIAGNFDIRKNIFVCLRIKFCILDIPFIIFRYRRFYRVVLTCNNQIARCQNRLRIENYLVSTNKAVFLCGQFNLIFLSRCEFCTVFQLERNRQTLTALFCSLRCTITYNRSTKFTVCWVRHECFKRISTAQFYQSKCEREIICGRICQLFSIHKNFSCDTSCTRVIPYSDRHLDDIALRRIFRIKFSILNAPFIAIVMIILCCGCSCILRCGCSCILRCRCSCGIFTTCNFQSASC